MSDDVQNQETLKEYLYKRYDQLCDEIVIFTISERDTGKKKFEEGLNGN